VAICAVITAHVAESGIEIFLEVVDEDFAAACEDVFTVGDHGIDGVDAFHLHGGAFLGLV
jgi:hypothetical protein